MTTLEIKLSDALAKRAQAAGLLSSESIEKLLADALRTKAYDEFLCVAERVEVAGIVPLSEEEIEAEIQAYRIERRGTQR